MLQLRVISEIACIVDPIMWKQKECKRGESLLSKNLLQDMSQYSNLTLSKIFHDKFSKLPQSIDVHGEEE